MIPSSRGRLQQQKEFPPMRQADPAVLRAKNKQPSPPSERGPAHITLHLLASSAAVALGMRTPQSRIGKQLDPKSKAAQKTLIGQPATAQNHSQGGPAPRRKPEQAAPIPVTTAAHTPTNAPTIVQTNIFGPLAMASKDFQLTNAAPKMGIANTAICNVATAKSSGPKTIAFPRLVPPIVNQYLRDKILKRDRRIDEFLFEDFQAELSISLADVPHDTSQFWNGGGGHPASKASQPAPGGDHVPAVTVMATVVTNLTL